VDRVPGMAAGGASACRVELEAGNTDVGRASIRTTFQLVVVLLAFSAIGVTAWIASAGATSALQEATYDRLTAIRETRRHALERYFEELGRHVVALSTSEATALALGDFRAAWQQVATASDGSPEHTALLRFYRDSMAPRASTALATDELLGRWFPPDPRVRMLQYEAIVANPHAVGAKDVLLDIGGGARVYGAAHAQHHPTFHSYQGAFGFYDIFLIAAPEGRVLYTVMKEVDLGADLTSEPYRSTGLGRAYQRVMALADLDAEPAVVIEDYTPYIASAFAPAAFVASPVRLAGGTVGVLAMQISIREVDRVMTQGRNWRDAGFGSTGQVYVVGADNTLRSDLRPQVEDPDSFLEALRADGVPAAIVDRIRADGTTVLNLPVDLRVVDRVDSDPRGTEVGVNRSGARVLRSHAALNIPDLRWTLVAEIDAGEAHAPARALRARIVAAGMVLAVVFFVVAGWVGASVTRPVLELARAVTRFGAGGPWPSAPVRSRDEVGQLAAAFNRMSADLERTMVSKTELEALAGRLLTAQEDERRRVGRELHDDMVQRVAATAIEVGRLERLAADHETLRSGLAQLKHTLARLSEDVHGLSRRIHPAMLDERGLVAAIEAECRALVERGGPPVDLRVHGDPERLPKDVRLALYRIVQEALRNVWQHAGATEAGITLEVGDDGEDRRVQGGEVGGVRLEVTDNGAGFDRAASRGKSGLGLASMEERARLLGGSLTMQSDPGYGTRVQVMLPAGVADGEATSHETDDSAR